MAGILLPGSDAETFLRNAIYSGYSMQEELFNPGVGDVVSKELQEAGYLIDYTELMPTENFHLKGMRVAKYLHQTLNSLLTQIYGAPGNYLPLFSVRIFNSGENGTTIHRNHPSVGPWAIGLTLKGSAPFNVYSQDQLSREYGSTIELKGDGTDPIPLESMEAGPGSAWTLYTDYEQTPHSSGQVASGEDRELLILYSTDWTRDAYSAAENTESE